MVTLVLLVGVAVTEPLSHDEHQFVSSGVLFADQGLLPYRDYPFFHVPVLTFVYAGFFKLFSNQLLAARLLSVLAAESTLALLFTAALKIFRGASTRHRVIMAALIVVLLCDSPLFMDAASHAVNLAPSVAFTLAAFLMLLRGERRGGQSRWLLLSGGLLGLASGVRLTVAPAGAPFLLMATFTGSGTRWSDRLRCAAVFLAGLVLGSIPMIACFAVAPRQFLFGNFQYPVMNTLYRQRDGYENAMTFAGKASYILHDVLSQPGDLVIVITSAAFLLGFRVRKSPGGMVGKSSALATMLVLAFLLAGSLSPTPSFSQYFYQLVPFSLLLLAYGAANMAATPKWRNLVLPLLGAATITSCFYSIPQYLRVRELLSADSWEPSSIHRLGREIAVALGQGKVLTLAPIYPLEGGANVYPKLATGPFAWRTADLLPIEDRARLGMVGADEIEPLVRASPPSGVLVGFEDDLEEPLVAYAKRRGFWPLRVSAQVTLWLDCTRARCSSE